MDKTDFPGELHANHHECTGSRCHAHNLFLHSEVIQSREWNLEDESVNQKQLKYEFYDTLLSMVIGWAINSAMIILAAATFFKQNIAVDELDQAQQLLVPLVGNNAGIIFAGALLLAGISSTITSGIAGASIFAGLYGEAYNHKDLHSKLGVLLSFIPSPAYHICSWVIRSKA